MARHCNPTAAKSTMIDGKITEVISQDAVLGTKLAKTFTCCGIITTNRLITKSYFCLPRSTSTGSFRADALITTIFMNDHYA